MTTVVPIESIVSKIVFFRGEKVLLDRDLADLYGVETKVLKQAVRRNIKRFPADFMFKLTTRGNAIFKVTKCDLKERAAFKVFTLCLHRTRCGDAVLCSQ